MIREDSEPAGDRFAQVREFVYALAEADWNDPRGPMRLSGEVKVDELEGSSFFVNTRLCLRVLAEEKGTDATSANSLNRAFVGRMFERMVLPKVFRESTRHVCKVINERDVWPLHLVRIVAECAGLVKRRGKRFAVTRLGQQLLPDDQAGALYRTVFIAYFRRFDLSYDFHLRDVPGIQRTIAAILWRLDVVARDWVPVRGLAPQVLLPNVYKQLRAAMTFPAHDTEEWILAGYVLEPLIDLGLLDKRKPSEWPSCTERDHIRVTPLWRRFISFEWNV